jgi:hypothetical protein
LTTATADGVTVTTPTSGGGMAPCGAFSPQADNASAAAATAAAVATQRIRWDFLIDNPMMAI